MSQQPDKRDEGLRILARMIAAAHRQQLRDAEALSLKAAEEVEPEGEI